MLMKVVVENGVKKLAPLTADAGSGNPCGTIITTLSNTVPSGYLPLGAQFDTTQFPVLYAILGSDTIPTASALGLPTLSAGRYVIKATSGINENQSDNVLSALTPVDQVALNNLHSVTSNAVAQAFNAISDTTIVVTKHKDYMYLYKFGKVVFMSLSGDWTELDADWNLSLATIPQGYRPIQTIKFKETTVDINATMYVYPTGEINVYNYDSAFNHLKNGQYYGCWITGE